MNDIRTLHLSLLAALLAMAGGFAWTAPGAQNGKKLTMNGTVVSNDIRMIDGSAYLKVSDMARALDMMVVKNTRGYQMTRSGGSNQIGHINGKIGESVFTGTWVFKVVSVAQVAEYTQRFDVAKETFAAKGEGETLVVAQCQLKNAARTSRDVYFWNGQSGDTSVTDQRQHGYHVADYDARSSDTITDKMLPGSAKEFAMIFRVPAGTELKDLIYSVGGADDIETTNLRISLKR